MKKIYIVKIGSSILVNKRRTLNMVRISHVVDQVKILKENGIDIVLVVSGAVACGAKYISFNSFNSDLKKVAAGIGQIHLLSILNQEFSRKGIRIAQILVTSNNLGTDQNKNGVKQTIDCYLEMGIIPILNENDVIELNSFGGNDLLAGEIAKLVNATKLVILSSWTKSLYGVGGGETKQQVISYLNTSNISTNIVNGKRKNILLKEVV